MKKVKKIKDRVLTGNEIIEEYKYKLQLGVKHSKTIDQLNDDEINKIYIPKKIKIKKVVE